MNPQNITILPITQTKGPQQLPVKDGGSVVNTGSATVYLTTKVNDIGNTSGNDVYPLLPNGSIPWAPGNPCYAWVESGTGNVYVTPVVNVVQTGVVNIQVSPGDSVPVTVEGTANVTVQSGTIDIGNTPDVSIAGGTVGISGTVDANISAGTVDVQNVSGTVIESTATAPQELLATVAGSTVSVSVSIPSNAETVGIVIPASYTGNVTVVGNTSGFSYPIGSISALSNSDFFQVAEVFAALDSSVTVTLSTAPGSTWFVVSDSVKRFTWAVTSNGSPLANGTVRAAFTNYVYGAGSLTVDVGWVAGDTLLVMIEGFGAGITSVSISDGTTLTQDSYIDDTSNANGNVISAIYRANMSTTAIGSVTVDLSLTSGSWAITVLDVVGTVSLFNKGTTSATTAGDLSVSLFTSATAKLAVVGASGYNSGNNGIILAASLAPRNAVFTGWSWNQGAYAGSHVPANYWYSFLPLSDSPNNTVDYHANFNTSITTATACVAIYG